MFHTLAHLTGSINLSPDVYRLSLTAPEIATAARPGHFLMVDCGAGSEHVLRRPFSIHRRPTKETVELLVRVVGESTSALVSTPVGAMVDVIGPLGRGFEIGPDMEAALLVAGGMGTAPLSFLAEELNGTTTRVYMAVGAATASRLLCLEELKGLTLKTVVATEDGSTGRAGLVTELLPDLVEEVRPRTYFACGPPPMLRAVVRALARYRMAGQLSMEEMMACGVGACLSCACSTKDGWRRVCADGPVFYAEELDW